MRKSFMILSTVLLLTCCVVFNTTSSFAASQPTMIEPMYLLTYKTCVSLSISTSGTASCYSYVKASNTSSLVSISVTLCKKEGSSWVPVRNWSDNNQVYSATVNESYDVPSGTYRLEMSGTVIAPDGTTENVSGTSAEKTLE